MVLVSLSCMLTHALQDHIVLHWDVLIKSLIFLPNQINWIIQDVPIMTAAVAFDDPKTGVTCILILGQAIFMSDRVASSHPNYLQANGILVDGVPIHLSQPDK